MVYEAPRTPYDVSIGMFKILGLAKNLTQHSQLTQLEQAFKSLAQNSKKEVYGFDPSISVQIDNNMTSILHITHQMVKDNDVPATFEQILEQEFPNQVALANRIDALAEEEDRIAELATEPTEDQKWAAEFTNTKDGMLALIEGKTTADIFSILQTDDLDALYNDKNFKDYNDRLRNG